MDYISVNEFKKQSDKVQKVLLDWWKENVKQYDMFYRKSNVGFDWSGRQKYIITKVKGCKLETITLRNIKISAGRDAWTEKWNIQCIWDIIPLLTEDQLRKFIIGKGYKYIGINNFLELENKETWNIKVFKSMMQFKPDLEFVGDTALECCWKVVCEIAESEEI